jgi:TolB protein
MKLPVLLSIGVVAATLCVGATPTSSSVAEAVLTAATPQEIGLTLKGAGGQAPHVAVPEFVALTADQETRDAAKAMAQVLYDDLVFEREFDAIPPASFARVPVARTLETIPYAQWSDLGADAVVFATVSGTANGFTVEVSVMAVASHVPLRQWQYSQSKNARFIAHTISDAMHKELRGLAGVARTKLAFSSDRDGERVAKTVQDRSVQEIYVSDYDGANQQKVTRHQSLDIGPSWSPDGLSLAYTSYSDGNAETFVQTIFGNQEMLKKPLRTAGMVPNQTVSWSADGTKFAFASDRDHDGNYEIYVANRDGSGLLRLISDPHSIQVSPTWSPDGRHLAFIYDRAGSPQVYTISIDGTDLRKLTSRGKCDRPTWSPTQSEIAYTSENSSGGFDINIVSASGGEPRVLTDGQGTNESPAFSPNGRHIAYTTTRWGKAQIAIVGRDGKMEKRVTTTGNNKYPSWARSMFPNSK